MTRVALNYESRRIALTKPFWGHSMTVLSQMAESGLQDLEIRIWFIDRAKRTKGDLGFSYNLLRLILCPLNELKVPNFTVLMRNWPWEADHVRGILREEPKFSVEFFDTKYCPGHTELT